MKWDTPLTFAAGYNLGLVVMGIVGEVVGARVYYYPSDAMFTMFCVGLALWMRKRA